MPFEYMVDAANRMYEILFDETVSLEEKQLREAATIGCNALQQVLRERAYIRTVVPALQSLRDSDRSTFLQVVGNFDHFSGSFLPLEYNVLVRNGIKPELANEITCQALELRDTIAHWESSPKDVSDNIRRLSNKVCELAAELERRRIAAEERQRQRRLLMLAVMGVAAIALIGINYEALGQGIFSPAGASGSGSVGEAILKTVVGSLL